MLECCRDLRRTSQEIGETTFITHVVFGFATHEVGAYVHQRLNLVANGKAHGRNAKASNRTWEIRPSGIIGGPRKRSHGGNENPTRNRKSGLGNPSPTSASELYPNHPYAADPTTGYLRFTAVQNLSGPACTGYT